MSFVITRQNKVTKERRQLSQNKKRWLPCNTDKRLAQFNHVEAAEFVRSHKETDKDYYYFITTKLLTA